MKRTFSIFLFSFLILNLFSIFAYSQGLDEYPMRFALIGDRTGGHDPGIYGQIVKEIQRMKPDFVLSVGDMIEGYSSDTTEINRQRKEYKELIKSFTMPIYLAPGNHDIWDSVSLELYKRDVGQPYFSFDIRGVHFIVLDNSIGETAGDLSKEQTNWLKNDLEKSKDAIYTVAYLHKPFWVETLAKDTTHSLHNLFVQNGVDAVFTGHYHSYFSGKYDGVIYTGVGSSGGGTIPGPTGVKYHFVWVTIDKDGFSIAPVKMGAVLPWDEVSGKENNLVYKINQQAINIQKPMANYDLTIPQSEIKVEIKNLNEEIILQDTIRWELPDGWNINPLELFVEIKPKESYTAQFAVQSSGEPYPTPVLCVQYPYAKDKKFEVKAPLSFSRIVYAQKAKPAPIIDGKLEEKLWKNPTKKLFAEDEKTIPTQPVDFYFGWDKDNLYLAARCMETEMDKIVDGAKKHDGTVYGEDCVGYFIQPQTDDGPVYQIYFNPLGTAFDQKIEVEGGVSTAADREWNGRYEAKTFKGKDFWSIEVKIPLSELDGEAESGKKWSINFRRKQKRLNAISDWLAPISYNPKDYGILWMK